MAFPDVIHGTNPYAYNYINQAPRPDPIPYYVGQTSITQSTEIDDRYNAIWLWIDSATDVTLTFPNTLLAGFNCTIIQRSTGRAFCVDQLGHPLNSESGVANTTSQWSVIFVMHRSDGELVAMWDGATGGGSPSTDYFSTSETLTSGASPVSINPAVFLTKIISGGTAGTEIVNFADYNVDQSGKPHLVVFDTQTDPADRIAIQGDSDLLVSSFGGLGPRIASTLMQLNAPNDGYVMSWSGVNWSLVGQVGTPTTTYPNQIIHDGLESVAGPSVMAQDVDNAFKLSPDPTNPFFHITITASSDIAHPTQIPTTAYSVGIVSTGLGAPGYVILGFPDTNSLHYTDIRQTIFWQTRVNLSDTIVFTGVNDLRNPDGTTFSSVTMTAPDALIVSHWDNTWVVEPETNAQLTPIVMVPLLGARPPYIVRASGGTRNVSTSENALSFMNTGAESFQLPAATGTGHWYTFLCNSASGITVLLGTGDTANVNGSTTTSGGNLSTSTVGRTITLQDVASHLWMATSQLGAWTLA